MGGEGRAEALSESLGMSKQVKKWLKFLFRKCGNCPFRIICWSELFHSTLAINMMAICRQMRLVCGSHEFSDVGGGFHFSEAHSAVYKSK